MRFEELAEKQRKSSGGNEKLYAQVGAVTWNTAALFHTATIQRQARRKVIKQLCKEFKIVALQETHGGKEDFETSLPHIARDFHVCCSRGPNPATGGVAFLIHKSLTESGDEILTDEFAEGRVVRVQVRGKRRLLIGWSVHNHGLTQAQLNRIEKKMKEDYGRERDGCRAVVWIGGDWNFRASGEEVFDPAGARKNDKHEGPRPGQKSLESALSKYVDLNSADLTHWCIATASFSRIDRLYTNLPEWALLNCQRTAGVWIDTLRLKPSVDSDHVPAWTKLAAKSAMHSNNRPIPGWVCKLPEFAQQAARLTKYADIQRLPPFARLEAHKEILKVAAKRTRNIELAGLGHGPAKRRKTLVLASLARAAWAGDAKLAKCLPKDDNDIMVHLGWQGRLPTLLERPAFCRKFQDAKRAECDERADEKASKAAGGKATRKRGGGLQRLAQLWAPFGKKVVLSGVVVGTAVVTGFAEKGHALGGFRGLRNSRRSPRTPMRPWRLLSSGLFRSSLAMCPRRGHSPSQQPPGSPRIQPLAPTACRTALGQEQGPKGQRPSPW